MAKTRDDGALVRYDAACHAIAQAKAVDEVKHIRDVSIAQKAYAKQAKNRQLELDASEIRMRAERRLGEMIAAQRQTIGLPSGGEKGGRKKLDGLRTIPSNSRPSLPEAGIDKNLAARARKLAAMPQAKFDHMVATLRTPSDPARFVSHKSDTPEHYTPRAVLDLVEQVFGGKPDLDPCAESDKRSNVGAKKVYTKDDDGLAHPWAGRVFVNPPYGRVIGDWTAKIRVEWARGEITELIALLPARTDTEWFEALTVDTDDAIVCFIHQRLTFLGNEAGAPFPSVAVYFGPRHDVFAEVFGELGSLWQRPSRPREWFVDHS